MRLNLLGMKEVASKYLQCTFEFKSYNDTFISLRRRANARNASTSFLPYGGITFLINPFDYPNLLFLMIHSALLNVLADPYDTATD